MGDRTCLNDIPGENGGTGEDTDGDQPGTHADKQRDPGKARP